MKWFRQLVGRVTRSIEGTWHRIDFGSAPGSITVTPQTALTFSACYAAINVLATDTASLPLGVYRREPGGGTMPAPDHPVHDLVHVEPNGTTSSIRFRQALLAHVLGWGNGYAEIERARSGRPLALHLLSPATTRPRWRPDGTLGYLIEDGKKELEPADVIHVAGLGFDGLVGYSPVGLARRAIRLGISAETMGISLFDNGSIAKGYLKTPKRLTDEAYKRLREQQEAIHQGAANANRLGILEEGMEFQQTSIDPEDAQFLATRAFQILEICRIYRLPPNKLADYSQAHLANVEESNIDYLTTTLMPWLEIIESELNRKLFTKEERRVFFVEHDMSRLMRGNMQARSSFYWQLFQMGALSPNDILQRENLNPIGPDGDRRFVPANLIALDLAGQPPATPRGTRTILRLLKRIAGRQAA